MQGDGVRSGSESESVGESERESMSAVVERGREEEGERGRGKGGTREEGSTHSAHRLWSQHPHSLPLQRQHLQSQRLSPHCKELGPQAHHRKDPLALRLRCTNLGPLAGQCEEVFPLGQ